MPLSDAATQFLDQKLGANTGDNKELQFKALDDLLAGKQVEGVKMPELPPTKWDVTKEAAWDVAKYPVAAGEVATGMAAGMVSFPPNVIESVVSLPFDPSAKTAERIDEKYARWVQPFMPRTELGRASMEHVTNAFETVLGPIHKLAEWSGQERPWLGYLTRVMGEVLAFEVARKGGQGVRKLVKEGRLNPRMRRKVKQKLEQAKEEIKARPEADEATVAEMPTVEELDAAINLLDVKPSELHSMVESARKARQRLDRLNKKVAGKTEEIRAEAEKIGSERIETVRPKGFDKPLPGDLVETSRLEDLLKPREAVKPGPEPKPELKPEVELNSKGKPRRRIVEPKPKSESLPSKNERSNVVELRPGQKVTWSGPKGVEFTGEVVGKGGKERIKVITADGKVKYPKQSQLRASEVTEPEVVKQAEPVVEPPAVELPVVEPKPAAEKVKPVEELPKEPPKPQENLSNKFAKDKSSLTTDELKQLEAERLKRYQEADYLKAESYEAAELALNEVRKELKYREMFEIPDEGIPEPPKPKSFAERMRESVKQAEETDFRDPGLWEDLKTIVKDERGSISNEPLSPEKAAAIERLVRKLKGSGKKMVDALIDAGMNPRDAAAVARKLGESPDEIQSSPSQLLRGDGSKIVQQRKIKVGGKDFHKPPVTMKDREAMKGLKEDLPGGIFKGAWTNPIRQFEKLGPHFKELYYAWREAQLNVDMEMVRERKFIRELSKELSKKEWNELGETWIGMQKNGPEILQNMGIRTVKQLHELSANQQRAYQVLDAKFKEFYNRINNMRLAIGQQPMKKLDNYLTFFRENGLLQDLGIKESLVNQKSFVINQAHKPSASATGFRFAKQRTGNRKAVLTNPVEIYSKYINQGIPHLHVSPVVAKVHELLRPIKSPRTGIKKSFSDFKPNAAEFLRQWSNQIAGLQEYPLPPRVAKAVGGLKKNLTFALLVANVRTFIVQPFAYINTFSEIPIRNQVGGIYSLIKEGFGRGMRESHELPNRLMETALDDVYSALKFGKYGEVKDVIGQKALMGTMKLDKLTAGITWEVARHHGKHKLGLTGEKLRRYADDVTVKTSGSGKRGDIAPIQTTGLGSAFTHFQTFAISQWNFLAKDVLGFRGKALPTRERFGKIMKFLIGVTAANIFFEDLLGIPSPFPTPIRTAQKSIEEGDNPAWTAVKIVGDVLTLLPGPGGGIRYASSPLGAVAEYFDETGRQLRGDPLSDPAAVYLGTGAGVPMTSQMWKMYRAYQGGEDALGVILGRYPEKSGPRRSRRSGRSRRRR
jgi:truncated hemoglobin YjbI